MSINFSSGKIEHMKALSDDQGVIAAAAMDQRGSLRKSIAGAKGISEDEVSDEMMREFKTAISTVLTPHASAILLDTEWGLEAAEARSEGSGLLLCYEKTGYDNSQPGRRAELVPDLSVQRLADFGADAAKILLFYSPFEDAVINDEKHAFVERVGAECLANNIPFFLEFIGYDPKGGDEKGLKSAKKKPEIVIRGMQEFSKEEYHVDVLKVEIPINLAYAKGSRVYSGETAYTKAQALEAYREAAEVALRPFIYLSAGVSNDQFTESLSWAAEAGVDFSGVLCGRATWKDGIPVYAEKGVAALEDWLAKDGVRNIGAVNNCLKRAKPWWTIYGAQRPSDLLG